MRHTHSCLFLSQPQKRRSLSRGEVGASPVARMNTLWHPPPLYEQALERGSPSNRGQSRRRLFLERGQALVTPPLHVQVPRFSTSGRRQRKATLEPPQARKGFLDPGCHYGLLLNYTPLPLVRGRRRLHIPPRPRRLQ